MRLLVHDMLVKVNGIRYVHVCEQARWAHSARNSAIENLCIIIVINYSWRNIQIFFAFLSVILDATLRFPLPSRQLFVTHHSDFLRLLISYLWRNILIFLNYAWRYILTFSSPHHGQVFMKLHSDCPLLLMSYSWLSLCGDNSRTSD